MRYPISEKTHKPYGMPKGAKATNPVDTDLVKKNEEILAANKKTVEDRAKADNPAVPTVIKAAAAAKVEDDKLKEAEAKKKAEATKANK